MNNHPEQGTESALHPNKSGIPNAPKELRPIEEAIERATYLAYRLFGHDSQGSARAITYKAARKALAQPNKPGRLYEKIAVELWKSYNARITPGSQNALTAEESRLIQAIRKSKLQGVEDLKVLAAAVSSSAKAIEAVSKRTGYKPSKVRRILEKSKSSL